MASIKKIIEALRHHYEKIVLVVVLLGLVGVAIALVIIVPTERQRLVDLATTIIARPTDRLPDMDLGPERAAMKLAQTPETLDFTTRHKLVNPVLWQILPLPSGRLQKIDSDRDFGLGALKITSINPLFLRVELGDASGDGYSVRVVDEAATRQSAREKNTIVFSGTPGDIFDQVTISGSPPEVRMEFKTNHVAVTVSAGKPWEQVDGYTVSLSYPRDPASLVIRSGSDTLRVNDRFQLEGDTYNIFAISENGIVVSSQANSKRTPIPFNSH
jgi:hypothetical protein